MIKDTVPKRDYTITLPYLGPLSNKIQKRIKTVFQKIIPAGKINIVFKTQRRRAHFLEFKDMITSCISSYVISHFKCPSCNAGYIGETRVHHKVRSSQHLGISEWTGRPTEGGVPTAVTKHIKEKKCICSLDATSPLSVGKQITISVILRKVCSLSFMTTNWINSRHPQSCFCFKPPLVLAVCF